MTRSVTLMRASSGKKSGNIGQGDRKGAMFPISTLLKGITEKVNSPIRNSVSLSIKRIGGRKGQIKKI